MDRAFDPLMSEHHLNNRMYCCWCLLYLIQKSFKCLILMAEMHLVKAILMLSWFLCLIHLHCSSLSCFPWHHLIAIPNIPTEIVFFPSDTSFTTNESSAPFLPRNIYPCSVAPWVQLFIKCRQFSSLPIHNLKFFIRPPDHSFHYIAMCLLL